LECSIFLISSTVDFIQSISSLDKPLESKASLAFLSKILLISSSLFLLSFIFLTLLSISVYKVSTGLPLTNNFTPLPNKGVNTLS
jgi:hypothetical protein